MNCEISNLIMHLKVILEERHIQFSILLSCSHNHAVKVMDDCEKIADQFAHWFDFIALAGKIFEFFGCLARYDLELFSGIGK